MRNLEVYIEIEGEDFLAGNIVGEHSENARFVYSKAYLESAYRPISISLPLQTEPFSSRQTKNFFEGLLPEGFSRRAVATWIQADENDYLTILTNLGQECIGALRIVDTESEMITPNYEYLNIEKVKALAAEGATKSTELLMESHLSLTGASGKVGLYFDKENDRWYQPKGDAPSTHIVKQSHVRLNQLVINELLCLRTAKKMGIYTSESFLIDVGTMRDEDILFATERYDRKEYSAKKINRLPVPYRLHQEDFALALGIASSDKYEKDGQGYMKKMFECLRQNSSNPIEDQLALWDMIVFNYMIGNTDAHLKNFSLLYDKTMKSVRLAPAYDIVCTRIYGLAKNMSFAIGGEKNIELINREVFKKATKEVGLGEKMALSRYDRIQRLFVSALCDAAKELSDEGISDATWIKDKILSFIK